MNHEIKTIQEALSLPRSQHFWVSHRNGQFDSGDPTSFFSDRLPDEKLTFDLSNNKVLANVGMNGVLQQLTIYRSSYYADHIPGVWVFKDFSTAGPFSFRINMEQEWIDLNEARCDWKTSLLDHIFPVTEFQWNGMSLTLLTFTPVSADGSRRLKGVVYGLYLRNDSDRTVRGHVIAPDFSGSPDVCVHVAEIQIASRDISFDLAPGQHLWVPAVLYAPGEPVPEQINRFGSLHWFNETRTYFRNMVGELEMPDDPFVAEFYRRSVYQCIGSIGMDGAGNIAGSNWGTYPTTREIWMKDMYYSFLPLFRCEPDLFREGILWFLAFGLRPKGSKYAGGVDFSLGNTLTPIVMAGLYYSSTGDKRFFLEHKDIHSRIKDILQQLLASRSSKEPRLFPSMWISDAYSLGDFHTGSNVLAWYAFQSYSRILSDVYGEVDLAKEYGRIADEIKTSLDAYNKIDGPFGQQYVEGTTADAQRKTRLSVKRYQERDTQFGLKYIADLIDHDEINLMMHDGEESDTTLMPLYGYLEPDDPAYKNYNRFAMSEHNPTYNPESKGIQWGRLSSATFPGYMTGIANITDSDTMSGAYGYLTEIRKLTDIDGSLWWWPYLNGEKYGRVVRHNHCGKCAWASGVFAGMFVSDILGIQYDAPARLLSFRPFSPTSRFTWTNCRIGRSLFDLGYARDGGKSEITVHNHNDYSITIELKFLLPHQTTVAQMTCNGVPLTADEGEAQMAQNTYTGILSPGEKKVVRVWTA